MEIADVQLRDLVVMLYTVLIFSGIALPLLGSIVIWGVNRWLKKQDVHNHVTAETLSELKTITKVLMTEMEYIKNYLFVVKYPKK